MRRFLAIFLLVLLPFQFSWAAVALYCGHEEQAGASHVGHHEHQHQHHAFGGGSAEPMADALADAQGDKAPGAADLDCGHCHGTCGVVISLTAGLPGLPAMEPPSATFDPVAGAPTPNRPERPQWLPLA